MLCPYHSVIEFTIRVAQYKLCIGKLSKNTNDCALSWHIKLASLAATRVASQATQRTVYSRKELLHF